MATLRQSVLWSGFRIDDSTGNVFVEGLDVKATNDVFKPNCVIINDTATKIGFHIAFQVPQNYVGSAKFIIVWGSTATSGDVENDIDYSSIAPGESLDPAAAVRSLNQNDTAEGTALDMAENQLTATAGDFAAGDICMAHITRDGTDAGDTMAAAQIILDVLFEYADA